MPLHWPDLLATDEDFKPARDGMEEAKAGALRELRANHGISPQVQTDLMAAADDLHTAFETAKPRLLEESIGDGVRVQQYLDAKHFVQETRHGVYRLVAARRLADVMPVDSFTGQTVDELMSYMARQGLRFAPAGPGDGAAYEMVFRQMAEYYIGLHGLAMAVNQHDRAIASLDAKARRLMELRDEDTLSAMKEVLEAHPRPEAFDRFCDAAEALAAIKETLFPVVQNAARRRTDCDFPTRRYRVPELSRHSRVAWRSHPC